MELSEIFGNRAIVLQLLDKQSEIRRREENVKLYQETYDPRQPGALIKYQQLHMNIDRQVLEELGFASCISDWENFTGIDDHVIPYFQKDEEACVLSGSLAKLFYAYRDHVDFLCVYLAEAHPADGWAWDKKFHYMMDHKTLNDRIDVARTLLSMDADNHQTFTDDPKNDSKVRLLADNITDDFARMYKAHPDRVLVIESGKIVHVGEYAEEQMRHPDRLMTDEARDWLRSRFPSK